MTAIEAMKKELERTLEKQAGYVTDSGHVKMAFRNEYNNTVKYATDLKWSIDWLKKMYEGKQEVEKKPYWVEVESTESDYHDIVLRGHNGFFMITGNSYVELRECRQMAKRLAKNLGIEYRGEK